jgi:hypothetical protein
MTAFRTKLAATVAIPTVLCSTVPANTTHAWSTGFSPAVELVPVVDIAGVTATGEPVLKWALSATRLRDRIIVVDEVAEKLLFFDLGGHLVRAVEHSRGTQPGELHLPSWVGRCASGQLFVFDDNLSRITIFDSSAKFVRYFRPPPFTQRISCSERGNLATMAIPARKPYTIWTLEPGFAPIQFFDTTGHYTSILPQIAAGEARPAGRTTSIAMSNDRLYVGTADSGVVDVYDLSARRIGTLDAGIRPRLMTRAEYESIVRRQLSRRAVPDSVQRAVLEAPMPTHHPSYQDLHAAPDGTLWITISAASDDATTLRALTANGRIVGDVRVAHQMHVLDVGDDYLIGEYRSPTGMEHVAVYSVRFAR